VHKRNKGGNVDKLQHEAGCLMPIKMKVIDNKDEIGDK
jgi:hypothetical protein